MATLTTGRWRRNAETCSSASAASRSRWSQSSWVRRCCSVVPNVGPFCPVTFDQGQGDLWVGRCMPLGMFYSRTHLAVPGVSGCSQMFSIVADQRRDKDKSLVTERFAFLTSTSLQSAFVEPRTELLPTASQPCTKDFRCESVSVVVLLFMDLSVFCADHQMTRWVFHFNWKCCRISVYCSNVTLLPPNRVFVVFYGKTIVTFCIFYFSSFQSDCGHNCRDSVCIMLTVWIA